MIYFKKKKKQDAIWCKLYDPGGPSTRHRVLVSAFMLCHLWQEMGGHEGATTDSARSLNPSYDTLHS